MKITGKDIRNGILGWSGTVGFLWVANYLDISLMITIAEAVTWTVYSVGTVMLVSALVIIHTSDSYLEDLWDRVEKNPDKYKYTWMNILQTGLFVVVTTSVLGWYGYTALIVLYLLINIATAYYSIFTNNFRKGVQQINKMVDNFEEYKDLSDEEVKEIIGESMRIKNES